MPKIVLTSAQSPNKSTNISTRPIPWGSAAVASAAELRANLYMCIHTHIYIVTTIDSNASRAKVTVDGTCSTLKAGGEYPPMMISLPLRNT